MTLYRRRMAAQRRQLGCFLAALVVIALAAVILQLYQMDLSTVHDADGLENFLQGKKWSVFLDVSEIEDTGLSLTVTESQHTKVSVMIPNAPPLPDIEVGRPLIRETLCRVYSAKLPGGAILLISRGAAPSSGRLVVTRKYHEDRDSILQELPHRWDEPVYVLAVGVYSLPWLMAALAASILLWLIVQRSPLPDRFSAFGRQIASVGDFAIISNELRHEMELPLLQNGGMALCEDYLLLFAERHTILFALSQLQSVTIDEPSSTDDDPVWRCRVADHRQQGGFLLYSQADVNALIRHVHRKCPLCILNEAAPLSMNPDP